jgi:hypothetical protein
MHGEWKRRIVMHMSTNMREGGTWQSSTVAPVPRAELVVGSCRGEARGVAAAVVGNEK